MALGPSRFRRIGESPFPHEEEALQFLQSVLPSTDPYQAWALFELLDPSTGRLLEVDALVIGYGALYLVEIKSHPGRISGDATDWWWQPPDAAGRKVWIDPPLRLANLKAKILKSRLAPHVRDVPWIQPLVFLGSPEVISDLRADGRSSVVTRAELRDALLKHQFPGSSPTWQNRRLTAPQVQAVARVLEDKLGIRARKGRLHAGDYELRELIDEGPGYQDRAAVHRANEKLHARARTYLVPQQTSVERRQQLLRAAAREADLLYEVREHPNVLSWLGYAPDAPLGPTILLDAFEGGQPLPAFLRSASPTYHTRLEILSQVARALGYCHRRAIVHGALSPEAVLVRSDPSTRLGAGTSVEVRLTNFQLGQGHDVEATSHWSALASVPWMLYQAPELREGQPRDARSDVYSLGALAYYLFTERAPADDLVELHQKLARDRALDVRLVDPNIPGALAEAIAFATQVGLASRADDAEEWLILLLDTLTDPALDEPEVDVDPLHAKKGDRLGDLVVQGVLGQGATARVLHVERAGGHVEKAGKDFALKVSLGPDHDERLRAEAQALAKIRHPRVVQLHEERTIADRPCLLLSLAGSGTLKRHLDEEGTVSLDFASRYGDDLLSALEHLEDEDVQIPHRDIKPANLGVGTAGKSAHHLTLFDFSLADLPATELGIGTSAYRDPFLPARGAWDTAADRWSAAVTLHEMLTGVRPSYGGALDPDAVLTLAAERFDPSVRGALVAFFEKALHRDARHRFASAKEMRHAWFVIFSAPADEPGPRAAEPAPELPEALTDDELRAIAVDTPIMALPLGFRARNALDRAGLLTARDLLALPENRLSAVRGVGTKVAQDILRFRERWSRLVGARSEPAEPFHPGYAGDDILVTTSGLDPAFAAALHDAALKTLDAVARAPRAHVEAIAARLGVDVASLRELLARETDRKNERGQPRTIEGLLDELLPKRIKRAAYVRMLFGLAPPFEGRLDVSAREVAEHTKKTTANIYLALGALRETWASHGALTELEERASSMLDAAGGALPLGRGADSLLAAFPPELPGNEASPNARARAAALLRIVGEAQKEDPDGMRVARLGRGELWLVRSQHHAEALRRLGAAADELAERDVVALAEAQPALESVARGTPLEGVTAAQLAELAAAASERAACSALLEIYPRGLRPDAALELSATLIASLARKDEGLTADEVRAKVAARYPEAAPLPARPELDAMLAKVRLRWSEDAVRYLREGEQGAPSTTFQSRTPTRTISSVTVPPRLTRRLGDGTVDDAFGVDIELAELDKRLRIAFEQRALRVLAVNPAYASDAARALEQRLELKARPLDTLLIAAMNAVMTEKKIRPDVVHAADREGRSGPGWPRLRTLMELAEARVIAELLADPSPLLLTRPGLLARYDLSKLLTALLERSQEDDAQAIFLMVPARDRGGIPRINDQLTIPGLLPTHVLRIPRAFTPPPSA